MLGHVAVFTLIASTALALGLPWLRGLSLNRAERVGLAAAVGLAVAGHVVLALGLVGGLEPVAIVALVLVGHGLAWRDLRDLIGRGEGGRGDPGPARRRWLGVAAGVLGLSPIVLCALYPPLGFDETAYHLPYARAFVRAGGLVFLPDLRYPVFPQLVDVLFAAVLALAGDVATHGVSLVAALAVALLVGAWAGRLSGAVAAVLAAAFWLGQPIGVHLAGSAYVEQALALFTAAAVYSAERWRHEGGRRWLVLAGLLAGTAVSTKYLGWLVALGVGVEIAAAAARRGGVRDVATYGGVVLAAIAATYGRLLYLTGNPLFPFFGEVFGPSPWDASSPLPRLGVQMGAALLRLPWDLVFDRAAVGGLPPFSPLILLGLPLAIAAAVWRREGWTWLIWIVGYVALAPVHAHYVWGIMPLAALTAGVAGAEALGRLARARRGLVWVCVTLCFLPGWLYGVYQLVRLGPMPADPAARAAFLTARRPLFAAVTAVNERCGDRCTMYAVHAEHMVYYAAGRFLGDWSGPASFARTLPPTADPALLRARLDRLGVDYLIVPVAFRSVIGLAGADGPGFRHVYGDAAADVYELDRLVE